jgi:hypothetical protein
MGSDKIKKNTGAIGPNLRGKIHDKGCFKCDAASCKARYDETLPCPRTEGG